MKMGIAIIGIIVIIIVLAGGYLVLKSGSNNVAHYTSTLNQNYNTSSSSSLVTTSIITQTSVTTTINNSNGPYTITVASNVIVGNYLVNSTNFALYIYKGDIQNSGKSSCNGTCASIWPPFYASNLILPSTLNISNFKNITRSDGTKQLTYKGWPLYLFKGDSKSGEISGNGINNFVVASLNNT